MLVLGRRIGERIILTLPDGREILVGLRAIDSRRKARIAIQAPPDVVVLREELTARQDTGGRHE